MEAAVTIWLAFSLFLHFLLSNIKIRDLEGKLSTMEKETICQVRKLMQERLVSCNLFGHLFIVSLIQRFHKHLLSTI